MTKLAENITYLRNSLDMKQGAFGSLFGLSRDNIASYERGHEPKLSNLLKIVNYFHVTVEQIVNENIADVLGSNLGSNLGGNLESKLVLNQQTPNYGPQVLTIDSQGNENIIYVPVKAAAGYLNGYGDREFIGSLPAYRMPGLNNGTFRMFEVKGHSMKGTLENGDTVIGEWTEPLSIRDEQVYVIIAKNDGICVKRCINRISTDGKLILKSDNREFDNIIIEAEDILEVWRAKLRLTHKFNAPAETFNRITDLEARMALLEHSLKRS